MIPTIFFQHFIVQHFSSHSIVKQIRPFEGFKITVDKIFALTKRMSGEGKFLGLPSVDKANRRRSSQTAWVDFLTAPSETSPHPSDDSDEEECASRRGSGAAVKQSSRIDDVIFDRFRDDSDLLLVGKFLAMMENAGLRRTDYRLADLLTNLRRILKEEETIHRGRLNDDYIGSIETLQLTRDEFAEIILTSLFIISTAFRNHFIIPRFDLFCHSIEDIYNECKDIRTGSVEQYFSKVDEVNPEIWGVAVCTIDGQRYSVGDTTVPVTLHAICKPLMYAYALQEVGRETVHKYVGQEPSGVRFNELILDHDKKPHNPIINSGSILIHSILQAFHHPKITAAERFDEMYKLFHKLSGGEYIGFNNGVFLRKREASDRNWALAHFMKENECFPPGTDLAHCIEYYMQSQSMETTIEVLSVIGATLANGGVCPTSGQRVLSDDVVADVLSVMFSCGMLDFSGKFAFRVGLPAKSGISGAILLVVPNVGGFAMFSPALDNYNNSVRGVAFCEKLVQNFTFHSFDVDKGDKIDPTRKTVETKGSNTILLKFSAAAGDLDSIFRLHLCGVDMGLYDCDGRTALHVAAAEGHHDICLYLLRQCGVRHDRKDRWGNTAYDEAIQFGHIRVAELLRNWHPKKRRYSSQSKSPRQSIDIRVTQLS